MDNKHDFVAKTLPESNKALWISVDNAVPLSFVFSLIGDKYIKGEKGQNVSVVAKWGEKERVAKLWCDKNERRKLVKCAASYSYEIAGYEDDVMVYIDCKPDDHQELITRARECLIIITTEGDG